MLESGQGCGQENEFSSRRNLNIGEVLVLAKLA